MEQKPETSRRDKFRVAAIVFLSQSFHGECSFDLRAPAVYRKELLAFSGDRFDLRLSWSADRESTCHGRATSR
jgi:hypothetical protein